MKKQARVRASRRSPARRRYHGSATCLSHLERNVPARQSNIAYQGAIWIVLKPTQEGTSVMSEEMPDFSNVQSGSSSTAQTIYEVKSGDSLSKIAKDHYGNANDWNRIFEANKDILDDPNKIYPGQRLKIPPK